MKNLHLLLSILATPFAASAAVVAPVKVVAAVTTTKTTTTTTTTTRSAAATATVSVTPLLPNVTNVLTVGKGMQYASVQAAVNAVPAKATVEQLINIVGFKRCVGEGRGGEGARFAGVTSYSPY
ncbi:hypothetical protein BDK51DRAFT_39763 [Blyttiomyces helicus]|uniref:Uncharacterized protein n=1 Tax=Blyttiomyces helicus TaxID=388810 RepID=A0A4P9WGP6_9FUNG|nr:hypothetical protein BDK51DRAFT_39763 [Blyttiomyces helicus]|eukprot:RKO90548.1 hypothetical protein BDK51DRAFT_39763 [Blyttiomyces helicus]